MNGLEFANLIKTKLEQMNGFTGKVYVYVPPFKGESEVAKALIEDVSGSKRINAWFVNRRRLRSYKYGEAPKITPLGYRNKTHEFMVRGFQSVVEDPINGQMSEERFQDLCDNIEGMFANTASLGISDHTVVVAGVNLDVDFENIANVLCHTVTITLTVSEYLSTAMQP